jgi:hypothetical protein
MKNLLITLLLVFLLFTGCKKNSNASTTDNQSSIHTRTNGASGTSYYVDPAGDDNNNGTSPATAWKTISKINTQTFLPGDLLLFKSGGSWSGNLQLLGSGTAEAPIVIDQYGTGAAPVINGGGLTNASVTLSLSNQSYWEINNLEITNTITSGLHYSVTGIKVNNPTTTANTHIYIKNCYVHDVNSTGVGNSNYNKGSGGIIFTGLINEVLVQNCHVANCQIEGIRTSSTVRASHVIFDHNLIENIYGDGIVLNGVTGGSMITNNTIRNACISNAANYAGAWTYNSYQTTISNNEVYGLVGGYNDGQAFDADINTDGDIFEYNYSHDNYRGFMLFMPNAKNIIVRYNISANDVLGGSKLFNFTATNASNQIYNNVFYLTNNISYIFQNKFTGSFTNNIINSTGTVAKFSQNAMTTDARFLNNCIYPNAVILANNWESSYHSNNIFFSPQFAKPGSYGVGRATATAFNLSSTSPCIAGGLAITSNGGVDFFNKTLNSSGNPDAGAIKY